MVLSFEPATAKDILGAIITPAVLISASGTLVLSTTNRLGRIVDRVRVLHKEVDGLPTPDSTPTETNEHLELIGDQIARQATRIHLLQTAASSLYLAISLLVATSLAVGMSAAIGWAFSWVPVLLGLGGASSLLLGAVTLIREARLAVHSTLREMDYVRRVVARKATRLIVPGSVEPQRPDSLITDPS